MIKYFNGALTVHHMKLNLTYITGKQDVKDGNMIPVIIWNIKIQQTKLFEKNYDHFILTQCNIQTPNKLIFC